MARPPKPGLLEHVKARVAERNTPGTVPDGETYTEVTEPAARAAVRGGTRLVNWVKAAPTERMPLPIAAGLYGSGALVHALDVPTWGVATAGASIAVATYGQAVKRLGDEHRAVKVAAVPALAGGWLATAAGLGVTGPATLGYAVLSGAAYVVYRLDDATRSRIAWRRDKTDWHRNAWRLKLTGSHLLAKDPTRLGERLLVDVTGTGQRASVIARSDLAERVAELHGLRTSRVKVREGKYAGQILIHIQYKNPWGTPVLHPLLDDEHEFALPAQADMCDPIVVGMDPESGRPLTVPLWLPEGGQNTVIISMKGGGKTVLLNDMLERVTSSFNGTAFGISTRKGKVIRRWAPALDLAAYGQDQRARGLRILEMACKAINYREQMNDAPTLVPDRDHPQLMVVMDEMAAQLRGIDRIAHASQQAVAYINESGRSEAVNTVLAGQRGTQSHIGNTDIRTQVDNFLIGKVGRQAEMTNVAGELGLELPNVASYGEGQAGVWVWATVDGSFQIGRTFFLDDFDDIETIVEDREPTPLEPGLVEYLGDEYLRLKYGDDALTTTLTQPRPQKPLPAPDSGEFLLQLDEEVEAGLPDDLRRKMDETASKIRDAQRDLEEAPLPPAPSPELTEKLKESADQRQEQAAQQTNIPDDARATIMTILGGGDASSGEIAKQLKVKPITAWRYLNRLRYEGRAESYGRGRGARWRLAGDGNGAAPSDSESP